MRRFEKRDSRFSNRALMTYMASSLPETLGLRAAAADAPAEILLYDEIGFWGVTATDFAAALARAGDGPIVLRINSPGGDVFDGYAIYNMLIARKASVDVIVDGLAASAASFIAMAGRTLTMGEASMLMIHNSWGMCVGDRHDMMDMAATQEKIDGQIATIYARKSGLDVAAIGTMLDDETWLTSTEAKAQGFCDAVITGDDAEPTNRVAAGPKNTHRTDFKALARTGARVRNALDGEDDEDIEDDANETQDVLDKLQAAQGLIAAAIADLAGDDDDDAEGAADPQNRTRRPRAAATDPEWMCSAAKDLPVDEAAQWDGPAAAERILDDAGFNGASPDPAKAKQAFLAWDHHNPKLKGSYKLPFADLIGGKLTAVRAGLDAAASRLPDADIPDTVKARARAVLDGYKSKDGASAAARKAAMERRLRLAQAEV